jgi:thiamine-phosphate pyrophosphorylase
LIRCYITDRHTLRGETLLDAIARNLRSGPDWIQIREKDLSARDLFSLVQAALVLPNPRGVRILVNTRADVALAAGAGGLHLPSGSPAPRRFRSLANDVAHALMPAAPPLLATPAEVSSGLSTQHARVIAPRHGFLIGVSCHSVAEVAAAEAAGADYAIFGPVFAPFSKASDLPPRGLEGLHQAAAAVSIPVLALGGITAANTANCVQADAAGIAGISLFQSC